MNNAGKTAVQTAAEKGYKGIVSTMERHAAGDRGAQKAMVIRNMLGDTIEGNDPDGTPAPPPKQKRATGRAVEGRGRGNKNKSVVPETPKPLQQKKSKARASLRPPLDKNKARRIKAVIVIQRWSSQLGFLLQCSTFRCQPRSCRVASLVATFPLSCHIRTLTRLFPGIGTGATAEYGLSGGSSSF